MLPVGISLGTVGTLVQATAELVGRHVGKGWANLVFQTTGAGPIELVLAGPVLGALAAGPSDALRVTGGEISIISAGPEPGEVTVVVETAGPVRLECRLMAKEPGVPE